MRLSGGKGDGVMTTKAAGTPVRAMLLISLHLFPFVPELHAQQESEEVKLIAPSNWIDGRSSLADGTTILKSSSLLRWSLISDSPWWTDPISTGTMISGTCATSGLTGKGIRHVVPCRMTSFGESREVW